MSDICGDSGASSTRESFSQRVPDVSRLATIFNAPSAQKENDATYSKRFTSIVSNAHSAHTEIDC
jgi:hypothetical protein